MMKIDHNYLPLSFAFCNGKINDGKCVYLFKQIRKVTKSNFGHFMLSLVFTDGKREIPQISTLGLLQQC